MRELFDKLAYRGFRCSFVLFSFTFLVFGCGSDFDGSDSLLNDGDISRLQSKYSCDDTSPAYQNLIDQKKYDQAVTWVCQSYKLDCGNNIYTNANHTNGYAYTNVITNNITVGFKALFYPHCQKPHDGWLAAVIGHEMIHTGQNRWDRYRASALGAYKINARLEIEAWQYMFDNADTFKLTTRMKIEIDSQVETYTKELNGIFEDDSKKKSKR